MLQSCLFSCQMHFNTKDAKVSQCSQRHPSNRTMSYSSRALCNLGALCVEKRRQRIIRIGAFWPDWPSRS
jgi:hypothetical protein